PKIARPETAQTSQPSNCHDCNKRRVLLIEDNRDAREMFRVMLELAGHEVLKSARPDVAVIDVGLPGLDGYEIARQFRAEPDSHRVMLVALTGYGTPEARELSRQAGFDHHLIKPVNTEALQEIMRADGSGSHADSAAAPRAGP